VALLCVSSLVVTSPESDNNRLFGAACAELISINLEKGPPQADDESFSSQGKGSCQLIWVAWLFDSMWGGTGYRPVAMDDLPDSRLKRSCSVSDLRARLQSDGGCEKTGLFTVLGQLSLLVSAHLRSRTSFIPPPRAVSIEIPESGLLSSFFQEPTAQCR
jgi:hypothetical protein